MPAKKSTSIQIDNMPHELQVKDIFKCFSVNESYLGHDLKLTSKFNKHLMIQDFWQYTIYAIVIVVAVKFLAIIIPSESMSNGLPILASVTFILFMVLILISFFNNSYRSKYYLDKWIVCEKIIDSDKKEKILVYDSTKYHSSNKAYKKEKIIEVSEYGRFILKPYHRETFSQWLRKLPPEDAHLASAAYGTYTPSQQSSNVTCPKCYSSSITANKKGFSLGKAAVGAALTGGIGLLGGLHGSNKVKITCLSCGHEWTPGKAY